MQFIQNGQPFPSWNPSTAPLPDDLGGLWDTPAELWDLAANTIPGGQEPNVNAVPIGSVGSGTANFLDDLPAVEKPKRSNSKEDRKLAVSREAQKRFRQRQKAKQKNIETELNDAKTELAEIKLRQQELEARNRLLEKVAELSKAQTSDSAQTSLMETPCFKHALGHAQVTAQGPQLPVTVRGAEQSLTVTTISQMSAADFSSLWTAYVQKLGTCLVAVDESEDDSSTADEALTKLSIEAAGVVCCLHHFNAATTKKLYALRLDNGQALEHQPGDAFYGQLVDAAKLSEGQITDMIYLWRMCSTRRGQLANARKAQLSQIPAECFSDVQMPDPRDNVANLTAMANFIKENGKEDFKVYSDTMCALYRGVLTIKQFALLHVHSYPYLIQLDALIEALARQHNEPSQQQVLATAHSVDTKPHWAKLRQYHNHLQGNEDHIHEYIPFVKFMEVQHSSGSDATAVDAVKQEWA